MSSPMKLPEILSLDGMREFGDEVGSVDLWY